MGQTVEFACESCGKTYPWNEKVAGKRVRCACGGVFVCPSQAPREDEGLELYDVEPEVPVAEVASKRAVLRQGSVRPVRLAGGVAPGEALDYERAEAKPPADEETIKNLWMPLWLLAGGVVVEIVAAFVAPSKVWLRVASQERFQAALIDVGVDLIGGTVFMLAGMLLAAKLRGIELGKFWVAVFKLSAISVAPAAVVSLITPVVMLLPVIGGLIGWVVGFMLYFALIGALFDLDEADTWYCVVVIFLIKVGAFLGIMFLLMK